MRFGLALFNCVTECLVRNMLSALPGKKGVSYQFELPQNGLVSYPKCLDAHRVPTIISLPNVREPGARVVWGSIAKF